MADPATVSKSFTCARRSFPLSPHPPENRCCPESHPSACSPRPRSPALLPPLPAGACARARPTCQQLTPRMQRVRDRGRRADVLVAVRAHRRGGDASRRRSAPPHPRTRCQAADETPPPPVRKFATEVVQPKVYAMDEAEQMDPSIIKGLFEQGVRRPAALTCLPPNANIRLLFPRNSSWPSRPTRTTEVPERRSPRPFSSLRVRSNFPWPPLGRRRDAARRPRRSWRSSWVVVLTMPYVGRAELAKVDPSVSVMCDVHNTLVNTVLRKYASPALKDKYLPQLSSSKVRLFRTPLIRRVVANANANKSARFLRALRALVRLRRIRAQDDRDQEQGRQLLHHFRVQDVDHQLRRGRDLPRGSHCAPFSR